MYDAMILLSGMISLGRDDTKVVASLMTVHALQVDQLVAVVVEDPVVVTHDMNLSTSASMCASANVWVRGSLNA